jgi:hypothetical protein
MPIMRIGVPINPVRPGGPDSGTAARRNRMESPESKRQAFGARPRITEADLIFMRDAAELGYLNRPRGLSAYYRAFGMLPPRYFAEDLPRVEFTNFDLNVLVDKVINLPGSRRVGVGCPYVR